jgi:hypothetical protein
MRRLFRWAFHSATAVSALLFVAVFVLWGRSHNWIDSVAVFRVGDVGLNEGYYSRLQNWYILYARFVQ